MQVHARNHYLSNFRSGKEMGIKIFTNSYIYEPFLGKNMSIIPIQIHTIKNYISKKKKGAHI